MNDFIPLTDENFILYCVKHYENPQCHSEKEFYEDLKHVKYIKKLFTRYDKTGILQERLILNHIIILNNIFGPEHSVRILFLKLNKYLCYLKPFLMILNILPHTVNNIGKTNETYYTSDIRIDDKIYERLKSL